MHDNNDTAQTCWVFFFLLLPNNEPINLKWSKTALDKITEKHKLNSRSDPCNVKRNWISVTSVAKLAGDKITVTRRVNLNPGDIGNPGCQKLLSL